MALISRKFCFYNFEVIFGHNGVKIGENVYFLGMDRISGSVSGIRRNPAIFQLSGIRPDTGYQKTGYPVSEYPAGYPANRIFIKHFFLY